MGEHVDLAGGMLGQDPIQEVQELLAPAALVVARRDLSAGDVERGEKRAGAVAGGFVREALRPTAERVSALPLGRRRQPSARSRAWRCGFCQRPPALPCGQRLRPLAISLRSVHRPPAPPRCGAAPETEPRCLRPGAQTRGPWKDPTNAAAPDEGHDGGGSARPGGHRHRPGARPPAARSSARNPWVAAPPRPPAHAPPSGHHTWACVRGAARRAKRPAAPRQSAAESC